VHGHSTLQYGGAPVPKKRGQIGAARRAVHGFFSPIEAAPRVELEPTTRGRPSDGGRPQEPRG
jgi:ubiquinol-cytochrome c reductase cytochrome b subunit